MSFSSAATHSSARSQTSLTVVSPTTTTVSGKIAWIVSASSKVAIDRVTFRIDGGPVLWTEYYAPYQFNGDPSGTLDTTRLLNGSHTLSAVALSSSGDTLAKVSQSIKVANFVAGSTSTTTTSKTTAPTATTTTTATGGATSVPGTTTSGSTTTPTSTTTSGGTSASATTTVPVTTTTTTTAKTTTPVTTTAATTTTPVTTTTTTTATATTTTTAAPTTPPASPSPGGAKLSALYALEDAWQPGSRVTVSTAAQLVAQASNPTASEVDVAAGTYAGQFEFSARPSSPVKFVFAPGVKFTGGPVSSSPTYVAVYITGSNLILWGPADVSNPSRDGIRCDSCSNIVIGGGIKTHDNGNQGLLIQEPSDNPNPPTNVWIDGLESTNNGTSAAAQLDGMGSYYLSGTHGIYWGDGTVGGGIVNSYVHDQPNGYCLQVYEGNVAGNGSTFAFNTFRNCTAQGQSGSDTGGLGAYFYDGGSNQTFVGNIVVGARYAGLGSHVSGGQAMGNVFWSNGQDVYNDSAPNVSVSDSRHQDPGLDDSGHAGASLKNTAAAYGAYLPRTDLAGNPRTTADPGAFAIG